MKWSPKQLQVQLLAARPPRHVILPGPAQSGKSLAAVYAFMRAASQNFSGHNMALVSKSLTSFNAVSGSYLQAFCREYGLDCHRSENSWQVQSLVSPTAPPNTFYRIIANDRSSIERSFGPRYAMAFLDEPTRYVDGFLDVFQTRLSGAGASAWYALNPDGPAHPFKLNYVDEADRNPEFGIHIPFALADNETLSEGFEADMRHALRGSPTLEAQLVDGKWEAPQGLIYQHVRRGRPPPSETAYQWEVAIDPAPAATTHALLIGRFPSEAWVTAEWRHNGRKDGDLTVHERVKRILDRFTPLITRPVARWIVDESQLDFINVLEAELYRRTRKQVRVIAAERHDETSRVQRTNIELSVEGLCISTSCTELIREILNYKYDPLTEKLPDHDNDGMDAMSYWVWEMARLEGRRIIRPATIAPRGFGQQGRITAAIAASVR